MLTTCKSVTNVSRIFLLHSHTLAVNLHVCKWRELPSMMSDSVWSVALARPVLVLTSLARWKKNWLDSPNLLQGGLWKTLTLELLFAIFDSAASSWHAFPQRRLQGDLPLHHQTLPSHMTEYYVCVRFWSGQIPFTIWIEYLVTTLFQECRRVLVSFQMILEEVETFKYGTWMFRGEMKVLVMILWFLVCVYVKKLLSFN